MAGRLQAGDEPSGDQGLQHGRRPAALEGRRRLAKGGPTGPIRSLQPPGASGPQTRPLQHGEDRALGLGDGVCGKGGREAEEAPVTEGGGVGGGDETCGRQVGRSGLRGAQRMNSGSGSTSNRTASISV